MLILEEKEIRSTRWKILEAQEGSTPNSTHIIQAQEQYPNGLNYWCEASR